MLVRVQRRHLRTRVSWQNSRSCSAVKAMPAHTCMPARAFGRFPRPWQHVSAVFFAAIVGSMDCSSLVRRHLYCYFCDTLPCFLSHSCFPLLPGAFLYVHIGPSAAVTLCSAEFYSSCILDCRRLFALFSWFPSFLTSEMRLSPLNCVGEHDLLCVTAVAIIHSHLNGPDHPPESQCVRCSTLRCVLQIRPGIGEYAQRLSTLMHMP